MAYFTCDQIVDIIQTQYFDKEEFMGRHNLTRRYFQPLTQVTISLAATALLCALENLREGQPLCGNPIPFHSVIYKGKLFLNQTLNYSDLIISRRSFRPLPKHLVEYVPDKIYPNNYLTSTKNFQPYKLEQ